MGVEPIPFHVHDDSTAGPGDSTGFNPACASTDRLSNAASSQALLELVQKTQALWGSALVGDEA